MSDTPETNDNSFNAGDVISIQHTDGRISVSIDDVKATFVSDVYSLGDGREVLFYANGDGMKPLIVEPLDKPLPARITAAETFIEPQSLVDYIEKFRRPEMIGKASMRGRTIAVTLDYHAGVEVQDGSRITLLASVGANTHTANLKCEYDPDFVTWQAIFAKTEGFLQEPFGDMLEDMMHTIAAPAAAELLSAVRDIQIERASKIKSKINKGSGTVNLIFEEIDNQSTSSYLLPDKITIVVPIFQGGPTRAIDAHLRYTLNDKTLRFKLVAPGLEKIIRDEFRSIAAGIELDAGVPIFYTA